MSIFGRKKKMNEQDFNNEEILEEILGETAESPVDDERRFNEEDKKTKTDGKDEKVEKTRSAEVINLEKQLNEAMQNLFPLPNLT